ncbi:TPA: hypothetical protein HA278_07350 [Candidatus Woesearchaeota archaeon]|nr:hypothetical protein [Candidatus Woesearchaeota archaeon]|tara:strand:+ start:209 stop:415 length:207 start_codon:yes stop_codon:yes gene_type:complete
MVDGQAGKGSKYRPVDRDKWDENWNKAFGKTEIDRKWPKNRDKSPGIMEPGGIFDMSKIKDESEYEDE